jgi:HNH endonuclease
MRCSNRSRSSISSAFRPVGIGPSSRHSLWAGTPERLRVDLAYGVIVGASAQATLPASPERRYALREIKARLHQASFRDAVLAAYGGRCAVSHLPEPRLLDAAHIIMDTDEQFGQPIVSNGLPLTKIHHAAFDAHLIGIDPDFQFTSLIGCSKSMIPVSRTRAERGRRAGDSTTEAE